MFSNRQIAFYGSIGVAVVGALLIWFGAAAVVLRLFGGDTQAAAPWLALAKFASLAWVALTGWAIAWRRLDERQQETRKFSWFIGSTAAILVTAPLMLFWLVNGGAMLDAVVGGRATPGAFFALGWATLLLAQLLGSLLARAERWVAER